MLLASFFFSLRPPSKESYYWWSKPGSLFPPPPPLLSADGPSPPPPLRIYGREEGGREAVDQCLRQDIRTIEEGRKIPFLHPSPPRPAAAIGRRRLRPPHAAAAYRRRKVVCPSKSDQFGGLHFFPLSSFGFYSAWVGCGSLLSRGGGHPNIHVFSFIFPRVITFLQGQGIVHTQGDRRN